MVVLEQCRIDQEGKCLIIEAAVENLSYYKNVSIASVIIDTQDTFVNTGPSNKAIYHLSFDDGGTEVAMYNKKRVKLTLSEKELGVSLSDNIFFVYIITQGIPDPHVPCGMDNIYTMGIAVNLRPIYNTAMKYIKELDSTCDIPRGFIDIILRLKAFNLSIRTGNFTTAFKYWDKLFKNKTDVSPSKNCGCNGINR